MVELKQEIEHMHWTAREDQKKYVNEISVLQQKLTYITQSNQELLDRQHDDLTRSFETLLQQKEDQLTQYNSNITQQLCQLESRLEDLKAENTRLHSSLGSSQKALVMTEDAASARIEQVQCISPCEYTTHSSVSY